MPRGRGGRGHRGGHRGHRGHRGRGWGPSYPYYGYPYYDPLLYDYYSQPDEPQIVVLNRGQEAASHSNINWQTIAISVLLSALLLFKVKGV